MRKTILFSILLLALAAPAAWAQKGAALQPGAFPLEELGLFPRDKLSVEINLEGALLRMISEATKQSDPGFSSLIAGLRSIQVQAFPVEGVDGTQGKNGIGRAIRWLEDKGWKPTVKVREKGEETYIYMQETDGKIMGLTVLSMDATEAVVINVVGRIDPAEIGRIGQRLNLPGMGKLPAQPQGSNKKPE